MLILQIALIIAIILGLGFFTRLAVIKRMEKVFFETPLENEEQQKQAYTTGVMRHEFYSGDYKLTGHWLEHSPDAKSVFILHGNNEVASEWLDFQLFLKGKGYNSFVFDYAGFGDSQGSPTINVLRLNTMSAWKEFNQISPSTEKIIASHSLGVAVLLDSINLLKEPAKKLILHGGFSSAREMCIHLKILPPFFTRIMPDIWNNEKAISKLNDFDITIVHSKDDQKLPFEMGERLSARNSSVRFVVLSNCAHNEIYERPQNVWDQLEI